MLQSFLFFWVLAFTFASASLVWSKDLKRFFIYSEIAWIFVFCGSLLISVSTSLAATLSGPFFLLILTACEAVTISCVLLVSFETRKINDSF